MTSSYEKRRYPPEYASSAWEQIGEDAAGGELYRLRIQHGWLVQAVGEGYASIGFVPGRDNVRDHLVDWSSQDKDEPEEDAKEGDEPPPMFA